MLQFHVIRQFIRRRRERRCRFNLISFRKGETSLGRNRSMMKNKKQKQKQKKKKKKKNLAIIQVVKM